MTCGSLFSGIGGIDLGLERAGFACKWMVEIDPFCRQVLAKHWPHVKQHGDITKLTGAELEPVDLLCGGFPCQDLSYAGKQAGIEASRSGLWFEYARLIGELRPRYVLIENVPGLLVHGAMRRVVGELARLGYVGIWRCFRASEFGASHLRKRVFLVAYRDTGRREDERRGGLFDGERETRRYDVNGCHPDVAHAAGEGLQKRGPAGERELRAQGGERLDDRPELDGFSLGAFAPGPSGILSDSMFAGLEKRERQRGDGTALQPSCGAESPGIHPERMAFAPGPSDPRWPLILRDRPDLAPALESPLRGVFVRTPDWLDRAMSNRTKRLSRLGNAVVPQISEYIGRRILEFDRWST